MPVLNRRRDLTDAVVAILQLDARVCSAAERRGVQIRKPPLERAGRPRVGRSDPDALRASLIVTQPG